MDLINNCKNGKHIKLVIINIITMRNNRCKKLDMKILKLQKNKIKNKALILKIWLKCIIKWNKYRNFQWLNLIKYFFIQKENWKRYGECDRKFSNKNEIIKYLNMICKENGTKNAGKNINEKLISNGYAEVSTPRESIKITKK